MTGKKNKPKISYKIPFITQYSLKNRDWQWRGCGLASLKMLMDYWHKINPNNASPSAEQLLKTGLEVGAYIKNVGWSHKGLVDIAVKFGYAGFNRDLKPNGLKMSRAWAILKDDFKKYPVMVSVFNRFDAKSGSGHIAILAGADGDSIYINDPAEKLESNGRKIVTLKKFLGAWRQRYITIFPEKLKKIKPNNRLNYLSMINGSVGSQMFRHNFVSVNGEVFDGAGDGRFSCAYYVSSILVIFKLIKELHANVTSTVRDMKHSGWYKIKNPKMGAVILWVKTSRGHDHLGFYVGDDQAISNHPSKRYPNKHHWTFGVKNGRPVRKIEAIYWHKRLDEK